MKLKNKCKILKFFLFLPNIFLFIIQLPFAILGTISNWITIINNWCIKICYKICSKPFAIYDKFFIKMILNKEEYKIFQSFNEKENGPKESAH